jgi:hypothetical protein
MIPLVWNKTRLYNQTLLVPGFPFFLGSYTGTMLAQNMSRIPKRTVLSSDLGSRDIGNVKTRGGTPSRMQAIHLTILPAGCVAQRAHLTRIHRRHNSEAMIHGTQQDSQPT